VGTDLFERIGSDITPVSSDPLAKKEERETFKGDAYRQERARQHLHNVFICFIWIAGMTFITLFIVRMLHFILPDAYCWLEDSRIQAIDKSLFSGAIGGLIMNHIKQTLPRSKE
jgi:hypothetical protein